MFKEIITFLFPIDNRSVGKPQNNKELICFYLNNQLSLWIPMETKGICVEIAKWHLHVEPTDVGYCYRNNNKIIIVFYIFFLLRNASTKKAQTDFNKKVEIKTCKILQVHVFRLFTLRSVREILCFLMLIWFSPKSKKTQMGIKALLPWDFS